MKLLLSQQHYNRKQFSSFKRKNDDYSSQFQNFEEDRNKVKNKIILLHFTLVQSKRDYY